MKRENNEAYDKFLSWLTQNNFYISSKIQITENSVAGRGIVSLQIISPPELLASFSKAIVLSPKNSYFSPLLSKLCYKAGVPSYPAQSDPLANVRLTLAFILEKSLGDKSFWKPYLDTLDEAAIPDSILLWGHDQLRFKGTNVYEKTNNVLKIYYEQYKEIVLPFFKECTSLPKSGPSWLDYLRACILTQSRCFYIDDYHKLSLVPFCDIFNHQSNPEIAFLECSNLITDSSSNYEPTDDFLCNFTLNSVVHKGDEIFNCFGSFCVDELLIQYGFLDPTCEIWQVDLERTIRSLFKEAFCKWKKYFDFESPYDPHSENCKLALEESSNHSRNLLSRHHKSLCIFSTLGPSFAMFSFICFLTYNSYVDRYPTTASLLPFSKLEKSLWNYHIEILGSREPKVEQELMTIYAEILKTLGSIYELRKSQYENGGLSASDYKFLLDNSSLEHESRALITIKVFYYELLLLESEHQRCIEIQSNLSRAKNES
ncbi:ribosomal lysine methyltransferase, SETD6-like protein [Schizosaccharomyces osmophilus]|uniref:Ribosomal lysine methyltransferase, SETD6-like protein n=1 Tax=Schizosaccharomyces osmophilus TaxID=2545709 RepID=A0AAE9WBJ1_9SCHI|nr:ribosomal lysine methyltransferase, SETD6-like protein [Schizosaccharomyces osmophilus]WBW73170.1 ribosomal lysine methyltransferase, SETD6-like protein [Schizosaccharomyces osmophilus]